MFVKLFIVSLYRRTVCISVIVILCGTISFLQTYSGSTNLSGFKTDWLNSYEKHQKYYEKRSECSDSLLAADPLRSVIYKEGKDILHLGEYICFKVVLFNGCGKPLVHGGDHLRARLFNDSVGAYTPGTIVDLQNGTYTLIFQALWTGLARLEAEILYTKEVIATSIRLRKKKDFSNTLAKFSYMNRRDSTKCSTDYETAARYSNKAKVCNFSYWNKTLPWYCAMPEHHLSCKNWVSVSSNWQHYIKGINKCEETLSVKRYFGVTF